jgi:hypothetical protein
MLIVERAVMVVAKALVLIAVSGGDFVGEAEVEMLEWLSREEVKLGESERHRSVLPILATFIAMGCSL